MKLLEMEKIVLNDDTLSTNPSNYTIKAFENFNFTFHLCILDCFRKFE